MNVFELYPEGSSSSVTRAEAFCWPASGGATSTVVANVGAWLGELGLVSPTAIDLVRLAAAAYMADRRSARGVGFTRTIQLHVQLVKPATWAPAIDDLADLLFWLTGDSWILELSREGIDHRSAPPEDAEAIGTVALLSGGLDSFCGAVVAGPTERLFLGHWDSSTVKGSQNGVARWMRDTFGSDFRYEQIRLIQAKKKRESSSRSRSLLFMALAAAIADARGAPIVEIPENGYTSLNPPLGPERGGALSTRSTHPSTITRFNGILAAVGLDVAAVVPHSDLNSSRSWEGSD